MAKFKIGDRVICIRNDKAHNIGADGNSTYDGHGWKEGYKFIISNITEHIILSSTDGDIPIYWKGYNGGGVFEPFLELVTLFKLYPKNTIIIDKNNSKGKIIECKENRIYIKYDEYPHLVLYIEEDFIKEIIGEEKII